MCSSRYILSVLFTVLLPIISSCGKKPAVSQENEDVLVTVGDSSLTVTEVVRRIPAGLSVEDSTSLFDRIVEEWVRDLVLADYAENNIPDIQRIDRMVEAYRNNLIVNQYLQSMSEGAKTEISEERIRRFYDANHESMVLEQPLVKGVFLKVAETDESLPGLRRWFAQFNDNAIDYIEKSGLRQALQYKYFKDEWIEWGAIAEQIPYRFFDADAFLRSTKNFETTDAGSVYLLRISDFVPSGSEMPYEFARLKIAEIIESSDVASYRKRLISDIYRRQINDGILKPGKYDPLTGNYKDDKRKDSGQDHAR